MRWPPQPSTGTGVTPGRAPGTEEGRDVRVGGVHAEDGLWETGRSGHSVGSVVFLKCVPLLRLRGGQPQKCHKIQATGISVTQYCLHEFFHFAWRGNARPGVQFGEGKGLRCDGMVKLRWPRTRMRLSGVLILQVSLMALTLTSTDARDTGWPQTVWHCHVMWSRRGAGSKASPHEWKHMPCICTGPNSRTHLLGVEAELDSHKYTPPPHCNTHNQLQQTCAERLPFFQVSEVIFRIHSCLKKTEVEKRKHYNGKTFDSNQINAKKPPCITLRNHRTRS